MDLWNSASFFVFFVLSMDPCYYLSLQMKSLSLLLTSREPYLLAGR